MSIPNYREDNIDSWYTGTVDLYNRPQVKDTEGNTMTVKSMSIGVTDEKGKSREMLIPTISKEGEVMSTEEAVQYAKQTGEHLGVYKNVKAANKAAQAIHKQQEKYYLKDNKSLLTGGQT